MSSNPVCCTASGLILEPLRSLPTGAHVHRVPAGASGTRIPCQRPQFGRASGDSNGSNSIPYQDFKCKSGPDGGDPFGVGTSPSKMTVLTMWYSDLLHLVCFSLP